MLGLGLGSQPTTECGIFGSKYSLKLDGNSDCLTPGSGLLSTVNKNIGTASFWVNIVQNDGDTSQVVFKIFTDTSNQISLIYHKHYTEWRASFKTAGTVRTAAYDIPGSSDADGSGYGLGWEHFTMTWSLDGGTYSVKIYRNGSLIQNTNGTGQDAWVGDVDTIVIGANQDESGAFVDGYIDQAAFWNVELDAQAIHAVYNGGVIRDLTTFHPSYSPAGLVGYYQMENNALDSSKTIAHGSLTGTAGFGLRQP
jgi:hypothetical protein